MMKGYGLAFLLFLLAGVGLQGRQLPSLPASACGQTARLDTRMLASPISGADTVYRFHVFNDAGFDSYVDVPGASFAFDYLPSGSIEGGKPYNISICWVANGTQISAYGDTCSITLAMPLTRLMPAQCGATFSSLSESLQAVAIDGATAYRFQLEPADGGSAIVKQSSSPLAALSGIAGASYGKQYAVRVQAMHGGIWGEFGEACSISLAGTPSSKVNGRYCSIQLDGMNISLGAVSVPGAAAYRFVALDISSGNAIDTAISPTPSVYAGAFRKLSYGKSYDMRVDIYLTGGWSNGASLCRIIPPSAVPAPAIKAYLCGGIYDSDAFMDTEHYVWLHEYQYDLLDAGGNLVSSINTFGAAIKLEAFGAALMPNSSYSIRARARSGTQWGSYGTPCQISTAPLKEIALKPAFCGISPESLSFGLEAEAIEGAKAYRFSIRDGVSGEQLEEIEVPRTYLLFSDVDEMGYGRSYRIAVAYNLGGIWSSYGQECNIQTPSIPNTGLLPYYCGTTIDTFAAVLRIKAVPLADGYRMAIFDRNTGQMLEEKSLQYTWVSLAMFDSLAFGTAYDFKAKAQANGEWGSYGDACQITVPQYSPTNLLPRQCGQVFTSLSDRLEAKPLAGAEEYKFALYNASGNTLVKEVSRNVPNIVLSQFGGISYKDKYTVKVKARIGHYWGTYGDGCRIEIDYSATTKLRDEFCGIELSNVDAILDAKPIPGVASYTFALYAGSRPTKVLAEVTSPGPYINMNLFSSDISYEGTYSIRVKPKDAKDYGPSCTVNMGSYAPLPTVPPTAVRNELCGLAPSGLDALLRAYPVSGASKYRFALYKGGVLLEAQERSTPAIAWSSFASVVYEEQYSIAVDAYASERWAGIGQQCSFVMPAVPSTEISEEYCGAAIASISDVIRCKGVPKATGYIFGLFKPGMMQPIQEVSKLGSGIRMSEFSLAIYGESYEIRVKALAGSASGQYGNACSVRMPPYPATRLSDEFCGISPESMSFTLAAYSLPLAQQYIFGLFSKDGILLEEVSQADQRVPLSRFTRMTYSTSYLVAVKGVFANGTQGAYGQKCSVNTPDVPPTMLRADVCNKTIANPWEDILRANQVMWATAYKFRIDDAESGVNIAELSSSTHWIRVKDIPGVGYGKSYRIHVQAIVGNMTGAVGDACVIGMGDIPATYIQDGICGNVLDDPANAVFRAQPVAYATEYIYGLFDGDALVEERSTTQTSISLRAFSQVSYRKEYAMKVKARAGDAIGVYGQGCPFSMPDVPAVKWQPYICGATELPLSVSLSAYSIPGASQYIFALYSPADTSLIEEQPSAVASIGLSRFKKISLGHSYLVAVKAIVPGGLESPYSDRCMVSIAEGMPLAPNPLVGEGISASEAMLSWTDASRIEEGYSVEVYDRSYPGFIEAAYLPASSESHAAAGLLSGTSYVFRVRAAKGGYNGAYSNWASIQTKVIQIIAPNGGEIFCSGGQLVASWVGAPVYVRDTLGIALENQGGGSLAIGQAQNSGVFNWAVPEGMDGKYRLQLYDSKGGLIDQSDAYFMVVTGCIQPYTGDNKTFVAMKPKLDEQYHATNGGELRFQLPEEVFASNTIAEAVVYDWKRAEVGRLSLLAMYGQNNYLVALDSAGPISVKDSAYYTLEAKDGAGQPYMLRFIKTEAEKLEASVDAFAKLWDCEGSAVVDIEASISGGTGPYIAEWRVGETLEMARNAEASLRKVEHIVGQGKGIAQGQPWLRVEDAPGYYVVLKIGDSCGQEYEQVLWLTCEQAVKARSAFNIKVIDFSILPKKG